jgi:hypothetical protein
MNMNAVRCSHYPPNKTFLETCDQLGLYVLDELAGWQKPPYDTPVGKKLVKEMVIRDVNHPSILFWNNGNEGGWNTDLDDDYALYDPQARPVLHPWAIFSGIDTGHYKTYDSTVNKLKGPKLFMPTEFLHGLYDGGHGAGLADYWSAVRSSQFGAGGFLWGFADEGLVRTDLNNKIDTAGSFAPDGLVGPYHQKEASFYTVRQIWSPVQLTFEPKIFDGTVGIENAYDFTNLNQITLTWQLVDFASPLSSDTGHTVRQKGTMPGPDLKPGQKGQLRLDLPDNWRSYDGLFLTAADMGNNELWTWSMPLKSRQQMSADNFKTPTESRFDVVAADSRIKITTGKHEFIFGAEKGLLEQVILDGRVFAIANGPRLVPAKASDSKPTVTHSQINGVYVLEAKNSGGLDSFCWKIYSGGLLTLEYAYSLRGDYDHFGITFDLPKSPIKSMRWLGQGPCHVWKNRLQGTWLDVWQRDYNQGIPGYIWEYPVFSGCYADWYWLDLQTQAGEIRVFNDIEGLYFRVGALQNGPDPKNLTITPIEGDLSFLHAIAPIGNKFHKASDVGPSGQLTTAHGTYKGQLKFQFE